MPSKQVKGINIGRNLYLYLYSPENQVIRVIASLHGVHVDKSFKSLELAIAYRDFLDYKSKLNTLSPDHLINKKNAMIIEWYVSKNCSPAYLAKKFNKPLYEIKNLIHAYNGVKKGVTITKQSRV